MADMTDMADMADTYELIVTERRRLADIFAGLTAEQWRAHSLCERWSVREVVAHMTAHLTRTEDEYMTAVIEAGGDMNTMLDGWARADATARSDADLLELYRSGVESRWEPGGGGLEGALSHDVIHGLDITVPLGLPGPATEAVARVLQTAGPMNLEFFGVDLTGVRLEATDADAVVGNGARVVELPATEILQVITARRPLPSPSGSA
ncbi:MAG: maleylpyruvate isomerase family mycothiol-dependent enzyme [Actinomycetales bacterium]